MGYSKGNFADSLGISKKELENRAKNAGYSTTEEFFNATNGTGRTYQDVIKKQANEEQGFLNRFRGAISAQPTTQSIYSRISGEEGLKTARDYATGLTQEGLSVQGELRALPEQVKNRSRGFDVNAAQLAKIQSSEANPIRDRLVQLSGAASSASARASSIGQTVSERVSAEVANLQRVLAPFGIEASLLSDRVAREVTGYNQAAQRTLQLTLQKLQNNQAVGLEELRQAGNLALAEKSYDTWLKQQQYGGGANTGTPAPTSLEDIVGTGNQAGSNKSDILNDSLGFSFTPSGNTNKAATPNLLDPIVNRAISYGTFSRPNIVNFGGQ